MAATTKPPPTPATLQTWAEAFAHPLPVALSLEAQLRSTIASNQQKLRSLVGASYRDLLGTAERIIEMDAQIQDVERYMADVGRRCSARGVERGVGNWRHWRGKKGLGTGRAGEEEEAMERMARGRVLRSCVDVCNRIVRRGGEARVAAKVLVLGRLLVKSLGGEGNGGDEEEGLGEVRRKLGVARKRLLGYIGRSLVRGNGDKIATADTLCAYALITSSTPRDVLRYFLQVQFEQLETTSEAPSGESLLKMLDVYGQTLLDTKEVFPRRFAESLSRLSDTALVRDKDVQACFELSLDVYEQRIPDDVRNFHPWVRHDQLSSSEVSDAMASWTKQAQGCLLQALADALANQTDAHDVLETRKKVLSRFLSVSAKLRTDDHIQAISNMRTTFLKRLDELADQAASLSSFTFDLRQPMVESGAKSNWDMATDELDLSGGAINFRKTVVQNQHGRDSSIVSVTEALNSWTERLESFMAVIGSMRSTRWDDDLDFDLDDLSDGESLQVVFSRQDPLQVETRLNQATSTALQEVYQKVEQSRESTTNPALLTRILREVDQRRQNLGDKLGEESINASSDFVRGLHQQIAMSIMKEPLVEYSKAMGSSGRTPVNLWDGSPPLPVQPLPITFRFLKLLHGKMSEAGNDLWSPEAIRALKRGLSLELSESIDFTWAEQQKGTTAGNDQAEAAEMDDSPEKVADTVPDTSTDAIKTRLIQQAFDFSYLGRVLASGKSEEQTLDKLVQQVKLHIPVDSAVEERLRKNANEYWRRTYLLFGLLAVGHMS